MTCKNGGVCEVHEYFMKERERDRGHIAELYQFYDILKDRIDNKINDCKVELHQEIRSDIEAAILGNRLWLICWIVGLSATISSVVSTVVRLLS